MHPCGMRPPPLCAQPGLAQFQFTHPCGMRLEEGTAAGVRGRFNSRTLAECDTRPSRAKACQVVFQFTHPCGMRLAPGSTKNAFRVVSIHAPSRDATGRGAAASTPQRVSIHAPLWDATCGVQSIAAAAFVSIHASLRDATCALPPPHLSLYCFNSRTLTECDRRQGTP